MAALWEEDKTAGGTVTPVAAGIAIDSGAGGTDYTSPRLIRALTPQAEKLILIAARVLLEDIAQSTLWLGFWDASNPLRSDPPNLVTIETYMEQGNRVYRGRTKKTLGMQSVATLTGLAFGATPVDLGIVIHGISSVDFIWGRDDGTWASVPLASDNVPVAAIRPALVYRKNNSTKPAIIQSLHIEELTLRE